MTRAKVERRLDREVSRSYRASKKQEQIEPSVTGKVYNHSMKEKRAVLDGLSAELQRIIGEPAQHEEVAMRLAAWS